MTWMPKRVSLAVAATAALITLSACDNVVTQDTVEKVPAFSEVEDAMWNAMLDADTVRVTVQAEEIADNIPEFFGIEANQLSWSTAVDGSRVSLHYGDNEDAVLYFGQTVYMKGDVAFAMYEDAFDEADISLLAEDLADLWVLMDSFEGNSAEYSIIEAVERMQEDLARTVADEGSLDELDADDVWMYPAEDADGWIKVAADRETPYLLESHSQDGTMTYSQWNAAEVPAEPAREQVVTEQEVVDAAADIASW